MCIYICISYIYIHEGTYFKTMCIYIYNPFLMNLYKSRKIQSLQSAIYAEPALAASSQTPEGNSNAAGNASKLVTWLPHTGK